MPVICGTHNSELFGFHFYILLVFIVIFRTATVLALSRLGFAPRVCSQDKIAIADPSRFAKYSAVENVDEPSPRLHANTLKAPLGGVCSAATNYRSSSSSTALVSLSHSYDSYPSSSSYYYYYDDDDFCSFTASFATTCYN